MAADNPVPFGQILIDTSFSWIDVSLLFTGPTVTVDGRQIRARWGLVPIDVPAGAHRLRVHTRYGRRPRGIARASVVVPAGGQVRLFYRAPAVMTHAGALGSGPQRTPGIGTSFLMGMVPALLTVVALLWVLR